jgi:hypothetical protein
VGDLVNRFFEGIHDRARLDAFIVVSGKPVKMPQQIQTYSDGHPLHCIQSYVVSKTGECCPPFVAQKD